MSKHYDILVVGAGFAGSMAALFAAQAGKSTLLITRGAGALTIGGGTVDVLGYLSDGSSLSRAGYAGPFDALEHAALPDSHPYRLVGTNTVRAACDAFMTLCSNFGYPYTRNGESNTQLATSIGTLKPSLLVPASMSMEHVAKARHVGIVGVVGLKDFYPHLLAHGLARRPAYQGKTLTPVTVDCPFDLSRPVRDVSVLDVARFLDSPEGQQWFIDRLNRLLNTDLQGVRESGVLLLPPILGSTPSFRVREHIEHTLGVPVYETVVAPPGITGWRLNSLVRAGLRQTGVALVEQAQVTRAVIEGARCTGVVTSMNGRERVYTARAVIVATGGLYGEGITVTPTSSRETLFGFELDSNPTQQSWSADRAFSSSSHGFANVGVAVNARLNPMQADGSALYDNVFFIGRTLGNYDHAIEKSGNGVALATAFAAVNNAIELDKRT